MRCQRTLAAAATSQVPYIYIYIYIYIYVCVCVWLRRLLLHFTPLKVIKHMRVSSTRNQHVHNMYIFDIKQSMKQLRPDFVRHVMQWPATFKLRYHFFQCLLPFSARTRLGSWSILQLGQRHAWRRYWAEQGGHGIEMSSVVPCKIHK